jgi:hypothetical protein
MNDVLDNTKVISFEADPLFMCVYEGEQCLVQLTCHGSGFREEWDIEIVLTKHIDMTWHDEEWMLVATTYGRMAAREIVRHYLSKEEIFVR